jgi:haloacid dehalogenase-like hydrolase
MQNLDSWPLADRRAISGVLTDIDDTLTTAGAITADALAALGDLKQAGLPVIAVTGRSVGWSEPFALAWPVDAIVAENGAVALFRTQVPEKATFSNQIGLQPSLDGRKQLSKRYQQGATERAANHDGDVGFASGAVACELRARHFAQHACRNLLQMGQVGGAFGRALLISF